MAGIGIVVGIFVFMFLGSFLGEAVLHNSGAGVFPALVGGIWAAWPFFHRSHVHRHNLLHPVPVEYNVPARNVFSKIRELLAETVYNYGDKWHVVTADTQTGRIIADLSFTDEHTNFNIDGKGHVHTHKERLRRYVGLDVLVQDTGKDTTILHLKFKPDAEGLHYTACDSIVSGINHAIDLMFGPGTPQDDPLDTKLPAPPWWLIGISIFALLGLSDDVLKAVFR